MAYADPPYPGKAAKHYRHEADYAGEVDHAVLIARLEDEFPDGWALSTNSSALRDVLPLARPGVRIGAWVKRYATWKKGINPVYAWEPVLFRGGRRRGLESEIVFDWVSSVPVLQQGVRGQKPDQFSYWLFRLLGLRRGDEFVDLYPGS